MNKQRIIIPIFLFLLTCTKIFGQDVHFSSIMASDMYLNPAKTAFTQSDIKLGTAYRNQWQTVSGRGYNTALITAEARALSSRRYRQSLGLGIGLAHDVAGSLKFGQRQLFASLSYNKQLSKRYEHFIAVGVSAGKSDWGFDLTHADFGSGTSVQEGIMLNETSAFDLGVGLHWQLSPSDENTVSAGFSLKHLNAPSYSFYENDDIRLAKRYTAYATYFFATTEQTYLNLIAQTSFQNDNYEVVLGGEYIYNFAMTVLDNEHLGVGLFYRTLDALIFSLRYSYNSLSVGLSYDINLSSLSKVSKTYGAIELWASYGLNIGNYKRQTKTIPCPTF